MSFTYDYPRPCITVDTVIFREIDNNSQLLLIKRANEPFKNSWALPGGFMEIDETLIDAAKRELEEETGIRDIELVQFGIYDDVNRDPRHRTIAIAFVGIANKKNKIIAGDDASDAKWFNIDDLPSLAFDHDLIVNDVLAMKANLIMRKALFS